MPIVNWCFSQLLQCIISIYTPWIHDMRRERDNRLLALPDSDAQNVLGANDLLGNAMKVFIAALLFAGIAAAGTSMILNAFQEPSYIAFTTSGARVGDPGHNLVGPG